MKRLLFILLMLPLMAWAQESALKLSRTTVNLGDISLKGKYSQTVMCYNTSSKPIVLIDVTTDCSCTKIKWSKHPLAASDSTALEITYAPTEKGFVYKKITVKSSQGVAQIILRGKVL